jgi:hypothetical protein
MRMLYRHLELGGALCEELLQTLAERPDIARHVHSLSVHSLHRHSSLSLIMADVALHMPALHTLIWDVPSQVIHNEMWDSLHEQYVPSPLALKCEYRLTVNHSSSSQLSSPKDNRN